MLFRSVQFSQPVISYNENFLGFPIGGAVPTGSYDRGGGTWVPENNGRIIKVLSVNNLAELDIDGSGNPAAGSASTEERRVGKGCRSRWAPDH